VKEAGSRKPETNCKVEAENWKLEIGNWKLGTGSRKHETGVWKLETGNCFHGGAGQIGGDTRK
jgi:hypothetical protein